jgi:hypothetical protein
MLPLAVVRISKDSHLKLLPVRSAKIFRTVGIMTLKNRILSPLAERFIACAREAAKPFATASRELRAI